MSIPSLFWLIWRLATVWRWCRSFCRKLIFLSLSYLSSPLSYVFSLLRTNTNELLSIFLSFSSHLYITSSKYCLFCRFKCFFGYRSKGLSVRRQNLYFYYCLLVLITSAMLISTISFSKIVYIFASLTEGCSDVDSRYYFLRLLTLLKLLVGD